MRKAMRLSSGMIGGALGHRCLHLDHTAHGIDDTGELQQQTVTRGLDDAPAMRSDRRIDDLTPQGFQCGKRTASSRPIRRE